MATGKQIMDKVDDIQGTSSKDIIFQRNQATIGGGAIGMVIGIYYGLTRKQNMLVCAAMGLIGGATIARIFTPKN